MSTPLVAIVMGSDSDWPTMTAGQKDTAMRETIRRLGIFLDRFADVLLVDGRS